MGQEQKTFHWEDLSPVLVFPIDYTSKESARKFKQDPRVFRKYVLNHALFKDILQELSSISEDETGASGHMPPIPLEAIEFLDCFYQLAKQTKEQYHKNLFSKKPNYDNIGLFWRDFCATLYEKTAPPQEKNSQDQYAFCRHILFHNEQFVSSLLESIWENEIVPRIAEIQTLVKKVSLQNQILALMNCLKSLDSTALALKSQMQAGTTSESPLVPAQVTEDSLRILLKSLLYFRGKCKASVKNHVAYKLPNISFDSTTLEQAFDGINRRGKNADATTQEDNSKTESLLLKTRRAYLSYLAKEVEGSPCMKESLALERQYGCLQNYLSASSSLKLEGLSEAILGRCKYHCLQVINYCMFTPDSNTDSTQSFTPHSY